MDFLSRFNWKKILQVALFVFVFISSAAGVYFYLTASRVFVGSQDSQGASNVAQFEGAFESIDPKDSYNVLLLGYGGPGHDGGSLSDVLIVANVNPLEKKVSLISIPRDTWVSIPVRSDISEKHKINAAFAIGSDDVKYPLKQPQFKGRAGGGELAKHVVSEVIGVPIDYFIAADFEGFKEAVDILGGIEVVVPKTFDDYFYPVKGLENEICGMSPEKIAEVHQKYTGFQLEKQFTCRYEHLHFDEGLTQMDGDVALKFVRSRHSDQHGGDFARSERQQALLVAVKDKVFSLGVLDDIVPFFDKVSHTFTTDIDKRVLQSLLDTHGGLSGYEVSMIRLSEENVFVASRSNAGAFILVPKAGDGNWEGVHEFLQDNN